MQSVLDGIGATVSCSIFAGVAAAVIMASARLDAVAERAREQASAEAIAVTSERDRGTTVELTLPTQPPPATEITKS